MSGAEPTTSVRERLLRDRKSLLDLSTRNRLLNVPLRSRNVRTIELVDERSEEIYRLLQDGKALTFLPGRNLSEEERAELAEDDVETGGIPQPEDDELDERGVARRHSDLRLQTRLTSEGLQKRLFDIWYDARTLEDEQGVNILFVGMGLLRWYDAESSDVARHAPLILLPVQLERTSAGERFKLKGRGEPASPNLSLQAKLKAEFSLIIEDFADEDDLDVAAYCAKVAATVSGMPRWEVLPDAMVLGFFSFAKFLMYRDLDPDNWPAETAIDKHTLITALLRDGFPEVEPIVADERAPIDSVIPPISLNHVVDADSSQALVVEEAARGRTIVVKGPPGTGKSQTITNIIAAAAAQGKRVLFVAEKMAALDVVHRRLQAVGLGPLTLELHSSKANKRAVLEELKRTKELALAPRRMDTSLVDALGTTRDALNGHVAMLHTVQQPYGLTPFQVIGQLIRIAGSQSLEVELAAAANWTPVERAERHDLARELADRLEAIGDPSAHPWRGVRCSPLDPPEQRALEGKVATLSRRLTSILSASAHSAELGVPDLQRLSDLDAAAVALAAAADLPHADRPALAALEWRQAPERVLALPAAGKRHVTATALADADFLPAARDADLSGIRSAVAIKGRSLFRWLDGNYRSQMALMGSYLRDKPPSDADQRIALIDRMLEAQDARRSFERAAGAAPAYGSLWAGEHSDWDALERLAEWRRHQNPAVLPEDFLARVAALPSLEEVREAHVVLSRELPALRQAMAELVAELDLDLGRAFGVATVNDIPLVSLRERLAAWSVSIESITRWTAFAGRIAHAQTCGLKPLADVLLDGQISAPEIVPVFEHAYYEAVRRDLFARLPALKSFDGELQDRTVARFRELDVARIELAREEIAHRHWQAMPRGGSGIGPLGVVNGELAKRRNLLPIRQLLEKGGPAVQALKPIFMMSPMSVAQFLKPGAIAFDVLVMDEASQIEPVDALGAIARAAQMIIVGDERQLPPTRFFAKLTGDDAEEDEESEEYLLRASAVESVLDLCLAKGVPDRMLNWHYRSKHQSLIAVSNREFYDNRLFIVPSPYDAVAGMGLKFHHLPNAHYDRGNTRTNPIEAKVVADAVVAHARKHPEQSIGVATFSTAQRQAIQKELELLRRADPSLEEFFGRGGAEPFFVKNLENIQGDERDVILISVGYGRTSTGYLAMSFGPLNGEGGERRLNVLISRAKMRCEVFSNITGDDIDLERARSRGVAALKMFLTFAQTGRLGFAEETGRGPDSVFEEQVAERLRAIGYDVRTQIGTAGFFVDLAVADPLKPGRFVIGIECDGAQYHSSRSARDRDRLRQQVLESHGWIIHRIWGADWYLRPEEELAKARAAIDAAILEWRERDEGATVLSKPVPLSFTAHSQDQDVDVVVAHVGPTPPDEVPISVPYREAAGISVPHEYEPHLAPPRDMVRIVTEIVRIEGPVHTDEIVARVRILWGLGRAGSRIRAAVVSALKLAAGSGAIVPAGEFWSALDGQVIVRDRGQVSSGSLRRPEALPPSEVDAALLAIVERNYGATREQLMLAASRAFGFAATSAQLRTVFAHGVNRLLASGGLVDKAGLLTLR